MNKIAHIVIALLLFFAFVPCAEAALLYISPADGTYTQGDRINIQVYVSSPVSLNAVSGTLSFPPKLFSVESISKSGSVLSFWIEEPSFSDTTGTINFGGVSPGSGYEGARGKVLSISLRALQPGKGDISFTGGSVLANDGSGTNILSSFGDAEFTIKSPAPKSAEPSSDAPDTEETVRIGPPEPPVIEKYKSTISPTEFFEAEGSASFSYADVVFKFEPVEGEGETVHGNTQAFYSGKFVFTLGQTLKSGVYKVSATVKNEKGVESAPSEPITLSVKISPWTLWGNKIVETLSLAIPLLALVVLIVVFLKRQFDKIRRLQKGLNRDIRHTEKSVHKTFTLLREDIAKQIRALEKARDSGSLTSEEEKIFEKLEEHISQAEEFLVQEVEDIDGK